MEKLSDIIKELIPPSDYQHRNGFSNEHLVEELSPELKVSVEVELLRMLEHSDDILIGETLTYLNSSKSIAVLESKLTNSEDPVSRINWASMVNSLRKGDEKMKGIAFQEFQKLEDKYQLISTFHTLYSFRDSRIDERIRSYINDTDYLIAYNARTSLGIPVKDLIEREQPKSKS